MSTTSAEPSPNLELWAQYHSVGPYGYADSGGETSNGLDVKAAKEVCNKLGQLHDICWVDFSVFVNDKPHRIGESLVATSQRRVLKVSFKPVSDVIESGVLTKHTSQWIGYLMLGEEKPAAVPDRFGELVRLLYE